MSGIIIAALTLGGLGLVFGALLAVVGKKFAVPEDPKRDSVRALLPGANCGGCGFAGCDAYAEAVAAGNAPVNRCPVGGDAVSKQIADLLGVTAEAQERMVAAVMCNGSEATCAVRFHYEGPKTCRDAVLAGNGDKACRYSCLGFGDCEALCPFGAIHVGDDRLARVDPDMCHGCGACVEGCPRGVLRLLPLKHPVHRTCSAMDKGKMVRDNCTAGCIGCGKCEKSCKFGALTMRDNLPQIDLEKCVGCMQCADECPTGALKSNDAFRRHAMIRVDKCLNCGACARTCQFDAINGATGARYSVTSWNCVGCGACEAVCPAHCIQMVPGAKYKTK